MAEQLHSAAAHNLPAFVTAPGETDVLMVVTAIFLGICVVGFGVLYFRLHSLPEQIAHKGQKVQFEIVAILGLIALFTHMHIFWIAALLLAFIDLPDFGGFLGRIAGSVERIAGVKPGSGAEGVPNRTPPHGAHDDHAGEETPAPRKPAGVPKKLECCRLGRMSALGHSQTLPRDRAMSALPSKSDISGRKRFVR